MHRLPLPQGPHPAAALGLLLLSFAVTTHLIHFLNSFSLLLKTDTTKILGIVLFELEATKRAGVLLAQPFPDALLVEDMATLQLDNKIILLNLG
jgi:hypothetical protein